MPIKRDYANDEMMDSIINAETHGEISDDHEDLVDEEEYIDTPLEESDEEEVKKFNAKYGINRRVKNKPELRKNNIILSVRHLKQFFFFGKGPRRAKNKAVSNISFDVHEGECVGIVGESGCGKTTTGRSIIKLYDITSGSIYYRGVRISAGDRWNRKEIKFTNIRRRKKIKELNLQYQNAIKGIHSQDESNELYELVEKARVLVTRDAKLKYAKNLHLSRNKSSFISYLNRNSHNAPKSQSPIKFAYKEDMKEYSLLKEQIWKIFAAEIKAANDFADGIVATQRRAIDQIEFDNKHVSRKLVNEIQMIFQDPIDSLDPRMTVEDIIQEGLKIQGHHNKAQNHKKVVEMLETVGLVADHASRYPHEFSGGQRQRIGIARALVMNPKLLICDEPISALDVSIRAQVINLLNELKEQFGLSIIFIAHDLSVVKYFCDRIVVMYFGKIVESASSDELFKNPMHPYTKALLSAIPKPNPITEKTRQRILYSPAMHDYSTDLPELRELKPGHQVYCNKAEFEEYLKQLKD